jgi:hypothetical protein
MARARASSAPKRLNRDSSRLVTLSLALHNSGSRVEDRFWETELANTLSKLMRAGNDATLDAALDHLSTTDIGGYEVLIEQAETHSESCVLEKDGKRFDVLLIIAPLVAWTRYSIPAVALSDSLVATLAGYLQTDVLATGAQIAMMPQLISLDQMPRTLCETYDWLHKLGATALDLPSGPPKLNHEPDSFNMLADTRYVAIGVAVPEGKPIFRWQETPSELGDGREACLEKWVADTQPIFANLLAGCGFEILVPDAYYVSNREADRQIRPLSVKSAVVWLEGALQLEASQLRAVIVGCGERTVEEYRIGFTQKNQTEVIYGCLWPLYGREEDEPLLEGQPAPIETIDEITNLLKECGITDIRRLSSMLNPEFCDDCGAPYFPNPSGEMVHAELPEDAETAPAHFH